MTEASFQILLCVRRSNWRWKWQKIHQFHSLCLFLCVRSASMVISGFQANTVALQTIHRFSLQCVEAATPRTHIRQCLLAQQQLCFFAALFSFRNFSPPTAMFAWVFISKFGQRSFSGDFFFASFRNECVRATLSISVSRSYTFIRRKSHSMPMELR